MKPAFTLLPLSLAAAWAQAPPVDVWAVPSVYKIRPNESPQARNLVWDKASKTVTLAGAANEHIPFQMVVSTPPPPTRYDPPAAGFFVEASDEE